MRAYYFLVSAVMALGLSTVDAQAATAPQYQPGDTFIFSNGRVEQFLREKGDAMTWATKSGNTYVRHRNFVLPTLAWNSADSLGERKLINSSTELWPLSAGASSRYRLLTNATLAAQKGKKPQKRRLSELWNCHVGADASIVVRAGRFQTRTVTCDRVSTGSMKVSRREVWYYAADVGHYVQKESINFVSGKRAKYELVATLSGRDANPARIDAIVRATGK